MADTVGARVERGIPLFGVCLGLQGIAEYFGSELKILDYPVPCQPSEIEVAETPLFEGLPRCYTIGRYHSLYVERGAAPDELEVIAWTGDGVAMAL